MTKKIFLNAFLVGVLVLVLSGLVFFWMQYTQAEDDTYAALREEAVYAEKGLATGGLAYLESLDNVNRITWIAADGEVIYDSEYELPIANQGDLTEVQLALQDGFGQGIRTSTSSGKSTMYYALRCDDGTVLRLSRPMSAVSDALVAVSPLMLLFVIVLIVSAALSMRAARQIVRPINDIDLDQPATAYPELAPLVDKISEQRSTIEREVAQREQLRREFSANVSHELKTPLTSISGFAELMEQGVMSEDEVRGFSHDIYKESQRLIALIDDIMKLSQLDEDAVLPKTEEVDLYELAADVLDVLHPAAEKQGIELELSGEHVTVMGVYRLLDEMVYNLCDNAIKYNQPGGSVRVHTSSDGRSVRLKVSDDGIGIPEEHQGRVFERFYRVDKSHSKEIGGTGLGLSIVKHGAQFHDAEVELWSKPGVGTSVTIVFPIA